MSVLDIEEKVEANKNNAISSPFEMSSSTVSAMDIEEKAEANENTDSSTMNYDVATIEDNANEKNFEIELGVVSLDTTENSMETFTEAEKDREEKVEDTILKDNKKKEIKSADSNFEIEHAVDSLEENGEVDDDLENVIDDPGYEEIKLVKDATPQPAKSAELECFGNKCVNLSKDVNEHDFRPEENASEDAADKSNDTTLKNVLCQFDPGIETDAAEVNHYNEAENEDEQENSNPNNENEMGRASISNDKLSSN